MMPKRETSGGAHFRDFATQLLKKCRRDGDAASNWIGSRIKHQTSRTDCDFLYHYAKETNTTSQPTHSLEMNSQQLFEFVH